MTPWPQTDGATPVSNREYLKDRSIETREQLCLGEAENIRKAHVKYLAAVPSNRAAAFTYAWALRLHKEMFGSVWKFAGMVRTSNVNIGLAFHQIGPKLFELLERDLPYWGAEPSMSPMMVATRLHHQAVKIHPFLDGNGRWSRMLANIWLKKHHGPVIEWPNDIAEANHPARQEYIDAIKLADDGELSLLLELHERYAPS